MKAPYEDKSIKQGAMDSVSFTDIVGNNIEYTVGETIGKMSPATPSTTSTSTTASST